MTRETVESVLSALAALTDEIDLDGCVKVGSSEYELLNLARLFEREATDWLTEQSRGSQLVAGEQ